MRSIFAAAFSPCFNHYKEHPMTINYVSAVLFVRDIAASRAFYEGLLGQRVEMDFGPNVSFQGGFALWEITHASQMIFERESVDSARLGGDNLELYFESGDLEAVQVRFEQAGVTFVHPIREHPWGQRVLRVYDPDGHIIEVGEPMPVVIERLLDAGDTVEAVIQRTGMPREMVETIAHNRV
jgi:catechol 2,3-dioxygenase-like lactoylglutathione lyase family enzyme